METGEAHWVEGGKDEVKEKECCRAEMNSRREKKVNAAAAGKFMSALFRPHDYKPEYS